MSLLEFNKRFGSITNIEAEQKKFVNRVDDILFDAIKEELGDDYGGFLEFLCFYLGESHKDMVRRLGIDPPLEYITNSNFMRTLKVLTVVLNNSKCSKIFISTTINVITNILKESPINIGIEFSGKQFYPTGEKLLDKDLIDFAMDSLKQYPEENKILQDALKHYISNDLRNTVQDCFILLEGLTKKVLKNDKRLDKNKDELLSFLKLSNDWGKMLAAFIQYFHDSRHASGEIPIPTETEACLYQTCLFVRLVIKSVP